VEFIELDRSQHPYFVATQAHPELKSRPTRAHPLFRGLIDAALAYNAAERLPVEIPETPSSIMPIDDPRSLSGSPAYQGAVR
jgi:CTP synthase